MAKQYMESRVKNIIQQETQNTMGLERAPSHYLRPNLNIFDNRVDHFLLLELGGDDGSSYP